MRALRMVVVAWPIFEALIIVLPGKAQEWKCRPKSLIRTQLKPTHYRALPRSRSRNALRRGDDAFEGHSTY